MQMATDIFDNYPAPQASTNIARPTIQVAVSYLIVRPSKTTKKPVTYVRLSDAEHTDLCDYVTAINMMATDKTNTSQYTSTNLILDKSSGIWGSQLRKFSTFRDVLAGVTDKLSKPHKYVRNRKGEDLSVKQLEAINSIITALHCPAIDIPTA